MSAARNTSAGAEKLTVSELVDLAFVYAGDGAFFSAAACLRRAADQFEERGRSFNGHKP